jgi:hypothetical protein
VLEVLLFVVPAKAFALVSEKFKFTNQNKSFGLWDFGSLVQMSA